jgi:hypothetical protein
MVILRDVRPTLDDDETHVVVINRIDDTRMGLPDVDAFIQYRLLMEERYPDVVVPETEAPKKKTTATRAPRIKPASRARVRRRAR